MNIWPPQRRAHRHIGVLIAAVVLLIVTLTVSTLAFPAQASTGITLVSNLGQVAAPDGWEQVGPSERVVYAQAQGFSTGSNEDGYSLSKIVAYLKDVSSDDAPKVSVYAADSHGNPDEILHTLSNPASFSNEARNTFTAPVGATLDADTDYFVVFENDVDGTGTAYYQVGFLDGNGQDSGGAAGWSLPTDRSYSVLVKIQGSVSKSTEYNQTSLRSATPRSVDTRNATAVTHISDRIVSRYEDDHEWVRRAWRDYPLPVRVGSYNNPGFYVYYILGRDGFSGVNRGARYGYTEWGYQSTKVVLHELAHHFLLDYRVPEVPGAVGVGWLYFNHRVKGDCPVGEIYADVLAYHTHRSASQSLGYLGNCPEIANRAKPDRESVRVAGSVARGEIADWFYDHYGDGDGAVDMDAVWADLKVANGKRTAAYHMRNMFGGYCSVREASWALGSSGPAFGNPWKDGGCHWRKPQDLAIITGNGELKVTWSPHLYETRPWVTHYAVQWRTADQDFHTSRQALISETDDLSHTIQELTDGTQHFVRVVGVNSGSTTVHQDNDGHHRWIATSATPGKPAPPSALNVTGADHEIQVSWAEPTHSEIELSGYRVQWKTGDEDFDDSRRLDLDSASTTSATIPGLQNAVFYTVRVQAIAHDDTVGNPAWKTVVTKGPPEAPTNVTAVGGRNSLLVSWGLPEEGTIHDAFVIQWRTGATYKPGDEVGVWRPWVGPHLLDDMAGHGRYYVRVLARNFLGRSEPSDEYFVMSGTPGQPTDLRVHVRRGGGFWLTWDRPDPYYPNNPDFRPVRDSNRRAIRDADGNTVPQFRYDVQYRLAGDPPGPWCSLDQYQDLQRGHNTLDPAVHTLTMTRFCDDAQPEIGEEYKFRIRASYVWKNSGDTNVRNGPWQYTGRVAYNPSGGPPDTPTGVKAVGGRESLLVSWDWPPSGTPADEYVVQWRTRGSYEPGDEAVVSNPAQGHGLLRNMAGHGRYHVRVMARNVLGESGYSEEYFVMSGAPGKPVDFEAEVRPGGGFHLTWDRPNPYYPNSPDFRPVRNFSNKRPIRDTDGNTVPQYRYDIEYKLADGQPDGWCSQDRRRDVGLGNDTLDRAALALDVTSYCSNAEPVVGERYNFRIRASYVWHNSGDTNPRNGQWAYSGPIEYNLAGGAPDAPTGIEAVGGRESLLVWWDPPASGGPIGGYIVQWRTRATYRTGDKVVVDDPSAVSRLLTNMAGHGRHYVRVKTYNILGESGPSEEYFVMSGAPHAPADVSAEVRAAGGFTVTWARPDPYYPNNPDFRPVRNFNNKRPIRDADGNTVPQYRYDIEYKLADGQSGPWCSRDRYRNVGRGNDTLSSAALTLNITNYCSNAQPAVGERYNFRIRASYVWHSSGDTNPRNGPWEYSGPIEYDPPVYNQN